MEFKEYERQYEKVFSEPNKLFKKCNPDLVSAKDDVMSRESYIMHFRDVMKSLDETVWDTAIKYIWLESKFCYNGAHRKKTRQNGYYLDTAFGVFMKAIIGYDNRSFNFGNSHLKKVKTYFPEIFPLFSEMSPFENPEYYKYPYKFITIGHMVTIYQVEERLDLLKIAEERKIGYYEFLDYILNWINCYNDEHGYTYEFIMSHIWQPYVKLMKKNEEA